MAIANLGRSLQGSSYVDSTTQAPQWRPFPHNTFPPGSPAYTEELRGYLDGDVTMINTKGSFNADVFTISGVQPNRILTVTPRATTARNERDSVVLVATGVTVGDVTPTDEQTYYVTTTSTDVERVFWSGTPGRTLNEGQTITIGLSQYIRGVPDDSFDSVSIVSSDPVSATRQQGGDTPWIVLQNANTSMARLSITAPQVNTNINVTVNMRVTRSTASPKTDDVSFTITVLDIVDPAVQGINVIRWDMPNQPIDAGTFQAIVVFDSALGGGDSLAPADFYIDGVPTGENGITINSVAVDTTDDKRYILSCTAAANLKGIATFGIVR